MGNLRLCQTGISVQQGQTIVGYFVQDAKWAMGARPASDKVILDFFGEYKWGKMMRDVFNGVIQTVATSYLSRITDMVKSTYLSGPPRRLDATSHRREIGTVSGLLRESTVFEPFKQTSPVEAHSKFFGSLIIGKDTPYAHLWVSDSGNKTTMVRAKPGHAIAVPTPSYGSFLPKVKDLHIYSFLRIRPKSQRKAGTTPTLGTWSRGASGRFTGGWEPYFWLVKQIKARSYLTTEEIMNNSSISALVAQMRDEITDKLIEQYKHELTNFYRPRADKAGGYNAGEGKGAKVPLRTYQKGGKKSALYNAENAWEVAHGKAKRELKDVGLEYVQVARTAEGVKRMTPAELKRVLTLAERLGEAKSRANKRGLIPIYNEKGKKALVSYEQYIHTTNLRGKLPRLWDKK